MTNMHFLLHIFKVESNSRFCDGFSIKQKLHRRTRNIISISMNISSDLISNCDIQIQMLNINIVLIDAH